MKTNGFTIVELLIVIVVIGILAALVVTSFAGAQTKARNASRHAEVIAWKKAFETYKATYGNYPVMGNGGYCLGTGFPSGKCRDYPSVGGNEYYESNSTALMSELQKVSSVQHVEHIGVNGTVGPYAEYRDTEIVLIIVINGNNGSCPSGMNQGWTDNAGRVLCNISLKK